MNAVFVGPAGERSLVTVDTNRLRDELLALDPKMVDVFYDAVTFAKRCGWQLQITSIFRTRTENRETGATTEIHCQAPHRAIDIRTRGVSPELVRDLDLYLDTRWEYDPERPKLSVSYEKKHGTGPHIHLQVCDRTVRREEKK